jgi:hypothetical protein
MITMARFTDGVEVLEDGCGTWRRPEPSEWVDIGDGNALQINGEGYASGFVHGLAAGVLVALVVLGVYAAAVSVGG